MAWYQPRAGNYNTSPLIYGDIYYSLLDRGFFESYDAETGEPVYGRQRIRVGGQLHVVALGLQRQDFRAERTGRHLRDPAGREFEVIGVNRLGELALASPAIAGDRLLIRTQSKLYSIRKEPESAP